MSSDLLTGWSMQAIWLTVIVLWVQCVNSILIVDKKLLCRLSYVCIVLRQYLHLPSLLAAANTVCKHVCMAGVWLVLGRTGCAQL